MKNIISMLTNKQEPNQIKQSTLSVGKSQQKIDSKEPQLITSQIPSKSDFNEQKLSKNKTFGTYH